MKLVLLNKINSKCTKHAKVPQVFCPTVSWCTSKREREKNTESKCEESSVCGGQFLSNISLTPSTAFCHAHTLKPSNLCQHRPPTLPVFKEQQKFQSSQLYQGPGCWTVGHDTYYIKWYCFNIFILCDLIFSSSLSCAVCICRRSGVWASKQQAWPFLWDSVLERL